MITYPVTKHWQILTLLSCKKRPQKTAGLVCIRFENNGENLSKFSHFSLMFFFFSESLLSQDCKNT